MVAEDKCDALTFVSFKAAVAFDNKGVTEENSTLILDDVISAGVLGLEADTAKMLCVALCKLLFSVCI